MIHSFYDSQSMIDYVRKNDVYVRHGDISIGNMIMVSYPDVHLVFDNQLDFDRWDSSGRPIQLTLF